MKNRTKHLALTTALVGALMAAVPSSASHLVCTDASSGTASTSDVSGLGLEGAYALPDSAPTALVVFAHGYGNRSVSWVNHLAAAADHGVVAVAMDYTGTGPAPDNRGMPLLAGAIDTVKAAEFFAEECGLDDVYLLGVSMGGAVSGLAIAEGPAGLFDYWIDVEGMTNVSETYVEASLVAESENEYAVQAAEDIHAETDGDPAALARRSVVTRIADIKLSGLKGAVVVHGVNDGLVPYNQGVEMANALRGALIPTDFVTVTRRSSEETGLADGSQENTDRRDTTLTSYAIPRSSFNEMSGHGWEGSSTHTVIRTALERLWALLEGNEPTGTTSVVDKDEVVSAP